MPDEPNPLSPSKQFLMPLLKDPEAALRLAALTLLLPLAIVIAIAYLAYSIEPSRPILMLSAVGAILLITSRVSSIPLIAICVIVVCTMIASEAFILNLVGPTEVRYDSEDRFAASQAFEVNREALLRVTDRIPAKGRELNDVVEISRYIQPRVFQAVRTGGRELQVFLNQYSQDESVAFEMRLLRRLELVRYELANFRDAQLTESGHVLGTFLYSSGQQPDTDDDSNLEPDEAIEGAVFTARYRGPQEFTFNVDNTNTYEVLTLPPDNGTAADTVLELYDNNRVLRALNDDNGFSLLSCVRAQLAPGRYHIRIMPWEDSEGGYSVKLRKLQGPDGEGDCDRQ